MAAAPDGVTGQTLPWDSSTRLLAAGSQPAWFWPATGRRKTIGGLPPDGSGYQFVGLVAAGQYRAAQAPRPAAPAAPGRPGPCTSSYVIDQATDRGLLLAPAVQRPGPPAYTLCDAAGSRPSRTFAGVIAATANAIAWAPACTPSCRVQVLDLATGRRMSVALPGASSAASAAFSPDGTLLALEVSFYNGGDDGALATQLDVVSVASGRLTVVPGTWPAAMPWSVSAGPQPKTA